MLGLCHLCSALLTLYSHYNKSQALTLSQCTPNGPANSTLNHLQPNATAVILSASDSGATVRRSSQMFLFIALQTNSISLKHILHPAFASDLASMCSYIKRLHCIPVATWENMFISLDTPGATTAQLLQVLWWINLNIIFSLNNKKLNVSILNLYNNFSVMIFTWTLTEHKNV